MILLKNKILSGKFALVTGVKNKKSIAWAVAKSWHEAGATLAFTYQSTEDREVLNEMVTSLGTSSLLYRCELSRDEDLDLLFEKLKVDFPNLNLILHSALGNKESFSEEGLINTSRQEFKETIDDQAYSLVAVCRKAVSIMKEGSSIITMSHFGSVKVFPSYGVLGVAKASLESSVRYLAYNLGARSIRVNAICVGPVSTDASELKEYHSKHSPLRKNVEASQVGETAVFLASEGAGSITGQVICVDSGYQVMGMCC